MAQGLLKKPSAPKANNHKSNAGITKKGARQIKPRNQQLQKQAKITRKLTSGLTAQTERMLGEKAGHLEMLGKGRNKGGPASAGVKNGVKGAAKGKDGKKS